MKNRLLLAALAFILLLAAGWIRWSTSRQNTGPGARTGDPVPSTGQARNRPHSNNPVAGKPVLNETAPAAEINPDSREAILAEIEEAAVTYDAAALPRIERFLLHPDPHVRESARNGMIVLGDAAAGPLLREASRQMSDPREAAVLVEAADYVELPPAPLKRRK